MPSLSTLHLIYVLSSSLISGKNTARTTTLSHLDDLCIAGPANDCHLLLTSLKFPATAALKITCHPQDQAGEDCHAIIAYLIPHVAAATTALPIVYLDVAATSRNVNVAIKRRYREVAHVLDAHIVFDVTFELPEGLHRRSLFHALCAVVPLENIEGLTIDISSDAGFEPSHWLNFLRNTEHRRWTCWIRRPCN